MSSLFAAGKKLNVLCQIIQIWNIRTMNVFFIILNETNILSNIFKIILDSVSALGVGSDEVVIQ